MPTPPLTRRRFIGQTACAALGLTGIASTLGTLRLFNATLSAQGLPANNDFKALVCLFLHGGNDGNNVLIPRDTTGYAAYAHDRSILALPRENLLPLTLPVGDGRSLGFHPSLGPLQSLFNSGQLAVLCNVGTLVAPITRAEYIAGGAAVPPYLFSHNDQQVQWQTSVPDSPRKIGWGGRLADLLQSLNQGAPISMNISLAGNNFFQVGNQVLQYQVSTEGSLGLDQYTATWSPMKEQFAGLRDILGQSYGHLFEQHYADTIQRAIGNDTFMKSVLATVPDYTAKFARSKLADGSLNPIAAQLHMILRLIAGRAGLGMRRQIFFATLYGFDTHDAQLASQAELLGQLSGAMADFYQATADLGVAQDVTTFTASDFNRTYTSNGKGSDHAWGNHQFVLGGSVLGGQLYGSLPVLSVNGPDDTGTRGSWIPTVSTDEYSATLARWFGVNNTDLPLVLPNISRFSRPNLGFMA